MLIQLVIIVHWYGYQRDSTFLWSLIIFITNYGSLNNRYNDVI